MPMGFPWFFLGYTQYHHLPLIQIASFGGGYCLSFMIVWVNRALYEIVFYPVRDLVPAVNSTVANGRPVSNGVYQRGLIQKVLFLLMSFGLLASVHTYGSFRLEKSSSNVNSPHLKIALIQGKIPQEEKWNPAQAQFILKKYEGLTREVVREKPDLIVWPETSLPSDLKKDQYLRRKIESLVLAVGCYFLLGGNDDRLDTEGVVTNAAFLVSPQGAIVD